MKIDFSYRSAAPLKQRRRKFWRSCKSSPRSATTAQ
jgi:hypothetical protein